MNSFGEVSGHAVGCLHLSSLAELASVLLTDASLRSGSLVGFASFVIFRLGLIGLEIRKCIYFFSSGWPVLSSLTEINPVPMFQKKRHKHVWNVGKLCSS